MTGLRSNAASLMLVTGLLIVVGGLAALQYRWTGELSDAERERMRKAAAESSRRLRDDFDARIVSIASRFRFDGESGFDLELRVADAFAGIGPSDTRLVGAIRLVRLGQGDVVRLDTQTLEWVPDDPPEAIRRLLGRAEGVARGFRFQPILPEGPYLVLPTGGPREPGGPGGGPTALVVVELDRAFLSEELLRELVARHFGDDDVREWSVRVVDPLDRSVMYATDDDRTADPPDFEEPLLGIQLANSILQPPGNGPRAEPPFRGPRGGRPPATFRGPRADPPGAPMPDSAPWRLEVRHRDGTLEQAVDRSRLRNLTLSGAVLVLLTVGGLLVIANAHKSRALATQQLEFVAAVTHELNTPIAAISSAGQNLADGVVREPDQIRRYGSVIAREGRRLSSMVDHVLEFAGMQTSPRQPELRPHPIGEIVDHALSTTAMLVEEGGVAVDREIRDSDRLVSCDRDALSRALANLVGNAIKYRGSSTRIVVAAGVDESTREVVFSVKDEGLGLRADEKKRVFEPFERGSNARTHAIRGSGLGLSIVKRIVEAHRGRVTVESAPGRGSLFTIRIPVS